MTGPSCLSRRLALLAALGAAACATEPAPTAAPAPAAAAGVDWSAATPVAVRMKEFSFEPSALTLRAGRPYRIALRNEGARGHDFAAPAFFRAASVRPGAETSAEAVRDGGIDVPAGATRAVELVAPAAGDYPLECTRPLHDLFGMTGRIRVEP
jgi:uncharacterized cupredoxin-like copper-binding protein